MVKPFSRVGLPRDSACCASGQATFKRASHARADVLRERLDVLTAELDLPARHPARLRITGRRRSHGADDARRARACWRGSGTRGGEGRDYRATCANAIATVASARSSSSGGTR
jgi:hypothetical protein